MKSLKTDTLIIGAGPAGLACAMELSKAGKDFIVVDKSSQVGGLAKTYSFKESSGLVFYTDNGPHRFFSKNQYLYSFIEDLIGEDWIRVQRQTRQFIDGKFYDYPVNLIQALRNIGPFKAVRMLFDYVYSKIQYGVFGKKIVSFEDYALANFGRSLANLNIINYTEKIWGVKAKEIHPEWALQRIKGVDIMSLLKNNIQRILKQRKKDGPKSMVDEFFYPSKGTGLIYETISNKIKENGHLVFLGTTPERIEHENNKIKRVFLRNLEGELVVECKNLVESVPITEFVKLLSPSSPKEVLKSSESLRHRHQVYLFITLDKESITSDQWIYFPSESNKVARISEMKNFSKDMSPAGKTSLFVEFFCFEEDLVWKMEASELFEVALEELSKVGLFSREDVRNYYHIKQKNVYPVYDLEYQKHLNNIKKHLDKFSNLYYIGRPGRFRYNNQDHSLEMGMLAAKSIIDGKKYDIEQVGSEDEYYESGTIKDVKK